MSMTSIISELEMKELTSLDFKQLNPDAVLPTYGSKDATGLDLYANYFKTSDGDIENVVEIDPGENIMVGTGIAVAIPLNHSGLILPRSGIASKRGLRPANTPGLIDPDYRGEIFVCLHNDSKETQILQKGERIAQLLLVYSPTYTPRFVPELSQTARGEGGFGSTGTK